MKRTVIISVLVLLAIGSVAAVGMSHDKATGDVTWTTAGGLEGLQTVFNVHVDAPGAEPVRGTVTLYHPDGGMRVVDVSCAAVDGNEAWAGGEIVYADGAFEGQVGEYVVNWFSDDGTPGSEGDMIGAWKRADACDLVGSWRGGGVVTEGNLVVH